MEKACRTANVPPTARGAAADLLQERRRSHQLPCFLRSKSCSHTSATTEVCSRGCFCVIPIVFARWPLSSTFHFPNFSFQSESSKPYCASCSSCNANQYVKCKHTQTRTHVFLLVTSEICGLEDLHEQQQQLSANTHPDSPRQQEHQPPHSSSYSPSTPSHKQHTARTSSLPGTPRLAPLPQQHAPTPLPPHIVQQVSPHPQQASSHSRSHSLSQPYTTHGHLPQPLRELLEAPVAHMQEYFKAIQHVLLTFDGGNSSAPSRFFLSSRSLYLDSFFSFLSPLCSPVVTFPSPLPPFSALTDVISVTGDTVLVLFGSAASVSRRDRQKEEKQWKERRRWGSRTNRVK